MPPALPDFRTRVTPGQSAKTFAFPADFQRIVPPMATLKLLTTPDHPDGSHRIGSPGGYEFWHFHAEDQSRRLRVAVSFHDGFALHPDYIRRYAAYRRNPTRNAPPTPSQYPCLQINVFENKKILASSTTYLTPGSLHTEDPQSLALGSSRAIFRESEIALAISESQLALSVKLTFEPILVLTPIEKSFPPAGAGEHHWIPARPLCQVHGQIRRSGRTIPFTGLGQHNHYYGTGPLSAVAGRWIRGCVLFPRAAEIFQAVARHAIAVTASKSGIQVSENPSFTAEWNHRFLRPPSHPITMNFGDRLILRNPRLASVIGPQLQIVYDAYVEGVQGTAWVEIDHP